MRVYVAPCGIGLGHITRCEPIADALRSQGAEIVFSTYLDGLEYARKNGFRLMDTVPIGFRVKEDGTIDFKMTAATSGFSLGMRRFLRQLNAEIRNLRAFRPNVVLSDSRASSLLAAKLLGIPSVLILNQYRVDIVRTPSRVRLGLFDRLFFLIANLGWTFIRTLIGGVWARSNRMVIPDLPRPYTISLGNLAIPKRYQDKVILVGPIVSIKPDSLPEQRTLKREFGFDPDRPLVYAAVSGPRTERAALAKVLIDALRESSDDFQVVLSRGDPNGESKPIKVGKVTVYGWVERQFELLKASDLVICRAGHGIIMKALVYGKPMILIPIPDHTEQQGNARRAERLGLAKAIRQDQVDRERLLALVRDVLSETRQTESRKLPVRLPQNLDAIRETAAITLRTAGAHTS